MSLRRLWLALLLAVSLEASAGETEVLFTPWDDAEGAIVEAIAAARQSVQVQAYLLTSRTIARALREAKARAIRVEVLADAEMVLKGDNSQIPQLAAAGIPVWLEVRYQNAHNKIILIDAATPAATVLTGSYNFTWSAQARNAENLLILRHQPELAARYFANWQRHRRDARPFVSTEKFVKED